MSLPPDPTSTAANGLVDTIADSAHSAQAPTFFLRSLQVKNFRAIRDATFTFQPGLNVIIGANNAAKTAAVDALRLLLGLGSFEKREDTIRLRPTDVCLDQTTEQGPKQISFLATFYGRSDSAPPAQFYEMACVDDTTSIGTPPTEYTVFKLLYQVTFELNAKTGRYTPGRGELRGGPTLSNPVSYDVMDWMKAVYLAPLRDLINDRTRVGAEIERLIISHTADTMATKRKAIPEELRTRLAQLVGEVTGGTHHTAASRNLAAYAKPYQLGDESLTFEPQGISEDLFRTMAPVFAHSLHGNGGLPLSSNGLGINQLIYASIVLSRRGDAEVDQHMHRFFLIEEPEAHLHPQLQDSFFHALNQITDHQIFVTSHSPTITAKTDLDKIIVMRRSTGDGPATPLHLADQFQGRDSDKRYLHKFLDVSRSQLLFATGAVFVEGVTEAMLMQRFSELIGHNLRDHGIEIVVIGSAWGFEHFRPLFAGAEGPYHRAVFITDGDESPRDVATDQAFVNDTTFDLDPGLEIDGQTAIAKGYGTLEFGLLRTAIAGTRNEPMLALLRDALRTAAPDNINSDNMDAYLKDFLDADQPSLAYRKMKENTLGTCVELDEWNASWHTNAPFKKVKSEFAFHLHEALSELPDEDANRAFTVPKYITDAIAFVTGATQANAATTAS
ncbi:ATP-dependent nuclease [Actinoplanes rectilineatus]|uniref:ATP-dependent nuclease n=1 Tax=Actinoplanes rectilineatus TaxID=113571 RepID=UPI0009F8749E|nr:AAA family ATPase [Actinoplanes rectilineatus]